MSSKINYSKSFYKSLNTLTGIPMKKLEDYAKENNPFNILEHPNVVPLTEKQMVKLSYLNEFISSYNLLRIQEEDNKFKFGSSKEAGQFFLSLLGNSTNKEKFMVAFLDNSNRLIEVRKVSEGSVSEAVVYPREILKMAIASDCKNIMLAHNHPGGSLKPSTADLNLTQKLVDIFHPLDIRILDHVIVGAGRFLSMAENENLPDSVLNKANYEPIVLDKDKIKEAPKGEDFEDGFVKENQEEEDLEL